MNKHYSLLGFLLLGFGLYFSLNLWSIPFLSAYNSWPSLLVIIGAVLLIYSYMTREYTGLFIGVLLLGFGIHFHALRLFAFWPDQWGMYVLIVGIAFLLKYSKTKAGLIPAIILTGVGLFALLSPTRPGWFMWIQQSVTWIERFWPLVLIGLGIYMIRKK
ncbi:hypothetical protein EQV77_01035 [Halobacillus fulvus]|nr:hypothetical protein EQV77_01035 [Halobacillus fulvus]